MASSLQAHGLSSPSVIARRSCLQSASAPCSSIVRSLHDCQRSTPGYRLGALHCELIHRQLRSINLRINDRCGGQFTVDMPSLAVGARGSYETSEKPSGSQELQVVPRITQEIQKKNSQTVAASGSAAQRTLTMHAMGILLAGSLLFGVSSADAVDALRTCACLLKECRVELARCIANPACAANVACLQTCNNRKDEVECQYNYPVIEERPYGECRFRISHHSYSDCDNCWGNLWFSDRGSFMIHKATHKIGCGDLFENAVVDQFNECAVTRHNCVPQKQDEGRFPIPPAETLVEKLDPQDLTGKWYITSGLNKTFDTFDCQLHEFTGRPSNLTAKLTWRIKTPDGGFFTRSAMQNFVQDKQQPGLLANHGNEFLHYSDDWYIVSAKTDHSADDYLFVYYRGSNDAWDGYGGAVVYTRSSTLPTSIVPDLEKAAKSVGLDFNKFTTTDNTCAPEPPLLARLEKQIERGEEFIAEEVEVEETFLVQGLKQVVNTVGKFLADIVNGEIKFFNNELEEARKEEEYILKQLGDEEKALLDDLNIGARDFVRIFGRPVPIRKIK